MKEKDVVRDLIVQLESRRALHGLAESEREAQVSAGVIWIRDRLSEALVKLADGSEASELVAQLVERCNEYLSAVPDPLGAHQPMRPAVMEALSRFRQAFRGTLAYLGKDGGIDRAIVLAERIPVSGIGFAGPSRTIIVEPPYPVRFTCRAESDFHPESGYFDVLRFEVFNNSNPERTVTVNSFGLEFEMHEWDTWYEREEARSSSRSPLEFPARLEPHDALEGWLPAEDLPERIEVYRDRIVDSHAYVEVAGYGKKIAVVE